ncbi:hypothetical protein [Streptomyces sp. NPDC050535]|uniref:hypothetical protein n=1 Tax=Streptomyces sp. NPDC050535 TaxID=3365626 RepID=UPI00379FC9D5
MEKSVQEEREGRQEEQESKHKVLDLTAVQVAASALATVVGAGLASLLGVTGTIIGAAVVSTSATTGAAVFQHAFRRTGEEIRNRVPVGGARTPGEERAEQRADARVAFGAPGASAPAALSESESDTTSRSGSRWKSFAWKKYALATGLVFALGMVTVTAVELLAGKPVAAVLKNESGSGTSVGGGTAGDPAPTDSGTPTSGESGDTESQPDDTASPEASATPDTSSSADPGPSPSASAPASSVPSSGDAVSSSDVTAD